MVSTQYEFFFDKMGMIDPFSKYCFWINVSSCGGVEISLSNDRTVGQTNFVSYLLVLYISGCFICEGVKAPILNLGRGYVKFMVYIPKTWLHIVVLVFIFHFRVYILSRDFVHSSILCLSCVM